MRKKATQRLPFNNPVVVRQYRDGKCIGIIRTKNAITNVGMNALLDVGFNGSSQSANWYMGSNRQFWLYRRCQYGYCI